MPQSPESRDPNGSLWSDRPAAAWLDAFPIGNGEIGAMVFGDPHQERFALNHENLWRGLTRDRTAPKMAHRLADVRSRFFAGDLAGGAQLAEEAFGGHGQRIMPYQPVGDLRVTHLPREGEAKIADYRRELDLTTGITTARWTIDGHAFVEESFVSAVAGLLVVQVRTGHPDGLKLGLRIDRRERDEPPGAAKRNQRDLGETEITRWASEKNLGVGGRFPEGITFAAEAGFQVEGERAAVLRGDWAPLDVTILGARTVTIRVAIATSNDDAPVESLRHQVHMRSAVVAPAFATLREEHLAEHRPPMERATIELPTPVEAATLPLHARLTRLRSGLPDPGLTALWFNVGRYLLFSSSRNCAHPANLQGLWSEELAPPWQCDFHLNINLQMNYWPAFVANLPETVPPLTNFITRFTPSAREVARDLYGAEGVFLPHATDVWGRATPEAPVCDVWMGAASWLAQHLWWQWEFTNDREFLATTAYPYIKECLAFWQSWLVPEARAGHPLAGRLVSVPSNSPENSYWWNGEKLRYGIGATMDLLLAREILTNALSASEILGLDAGERDGWRALRDQLPPLQIGRYGQLQEWLDDLEEPEPSHRHVSHLYGIFPGNWPVAEDDPAVFAAARRSLERRLEHGGGHTGWSRSWVAALWARFGDGERAAHHFDELIAQFATDALLDLHPPRIFQIDGNLGGTAAICEMLLQSHRGVIRLLPALPPSWETGRVSGLLARNQVSAALAWRDGAMTEAQLYVKTEAPLTVQLPDDRVYTVHADAPRDVTTWGAQEFDTDPVARDPVETERKGRTLAWTPVAGTRYVIVPAA